MGLSPALKSRRRIMSGLFEHAASGRAKCRGCAQPIKRGEIRFGERLPNPYAEGEMTLWFHPACAAYKRPEPFLEAVTEALTALPDREALERAARSSLEHPRLARIDGAERSPSGQATCRSCRQPIERGTWRIRLVFYEDGRFSPGGYVHIDCRKAYFETEEVLFHLLHFSGALSDAEREALRQVCCTAPD
jgi:hypothetical protein